MEARKQKALLASQLLAEHNITYDRSETNCSLSRFAKIYATEAMTGGLEQVNEEANNYCMNTFDIDETYDRRSYNFVTKSGEMRPRPASTTKYSEAKEAILVTPMPITNQVLSTKAAQAVLYRQFTMQLMPMYRERQRSAGKSNA